MHIFRSPVFVICCVLFVLHQVIQKGFGLAIPILDSYLDSLLAMPIFLSFLLLEKQILYRKGADYRLTVLEISMATLFIAMVSEVLFPYLSNRFTTDWRDLLLYTFGSVIFYFTINQRAVKKNNLS